MTRNFRYKIRPRAGQVETFSNEGSKRAKPTVTAEICWYGHLRGPVTLRLATERLTVELSPTLIWLNELRMMIRICYLFCDFLLIWDWTMLLDLFQSGYTRPFRDSVIWISTATQSATCGVTFDIGNTYVITGHWFSHISYQHKLT